MLQTVQLWKRLKALQQILGRYRSGFRKGAIASLLALALGLQACGDGPSSDAGPRVIKRMSEVSPPRVVQLLTTMNEFQPKVSIVSPRPDVVIDNDDVSVRFRVQGLDLYKDEALDIGPHLNVLVDNEFYGTVYDTTSALDLKGLTPGTHTVRAIAASAWDESFKNQDAYAQTTFHVFTKTPLTAPPDDLPLLTYSQPSNTYGAEPILLDYFFTPGSSTTTAAPQVPDEDQEPITQGWQVRATVNGEPFAFDQWEPIYLKGFKPGKNWVQIELLDENNQPIESLFNNTARIIQYEPGGDDTLSLLMRDELSIEEAGTLVDPSYTPPSPEIDEEIIEAAEDAAELESITEDVEEEATESSAASPDSIETEAQEKPGIEDVEAEVTEADEDSADTSDGQGQFLETDDGVTPDDNDVAPDSDESETFAPPEIVEFDQDGSSITESFDISPDEETFADNGMNDTPDNQRLDEVYADKSEVSDDIDEPESINESSIDAIANVEGENVEDENVEEQDEPSVDTTTKLAPNLDTEPEQSQDDDFEREVEDILEIVGDV